MTMYVDCSLPRAASDGTDCDVAPPEAAPSPLSPRGRCWDSGLRRAGAGSAGGPAGRVVTRTNLPPTGLGLRRALLLAECALSTRLQAGSEPWPRGAARWTHATHPPSPGGAGRSAPHAAFFLHYCSTWKWGSPGVPARGMETLAWALGQLGPHPPMCSFWQETARCGTWGRG